MNREKQDRSFFSCARFLCLILCLVLLTLLLLGQSGIVAFAMKQIPAISVFHGLFAFPGNPDFRTMHEFITDNQLQNLSISKEETSAALEMDTGMHHIPVSVAGPYLSLMNLKVVYGSEITLEMVEKHIPAAVISSRLAMALDPSMQDVLHRELVFVKRDAHGQETGRYTCVVVGIYEAEGSLWGKYSQDVFDRVYVPYVLFDPVGRESVDAVQWDGSIQDLYPVLMDNPRTSAFPSHSFFSDYSVLRMRSGNYMRISGWMATLVVIAWLLATMLRKGAYLWKNRECFTPYVRHDTSRGILSATLLLVASLAALFLLACLLPKPLFYFPPDVGDHYFAGLPSQMERLLNEIQVYNTRSGLLLGDGYLLRLYGSSMHFGRLLFLFSLPLIALMSLLAEQLFFSGSAIQRFVFLLLTLTSVVALMYHGSPMLLSVLLLPVIFAGLHYEKIKEKEGVDK